MKPAARSSLSLSAAQPGPVSGTHGESRQTPAPFRKQKYRARRTQVAGIWFMSKAEANRYAQLDLLLKAGVIRALRLQPRYSLTVNGVKIGEYRADFEYEDVGVARADGGLRWHRIAEDVKGFATDLYKWKSRHFRAEYKAIELREVKA